MVDTHFDLSLFENNDPQLANEFRKTARNFEMIMSNDDDNEPYKVSWAMAKSMVGGGRVSRIFKGLENDMQTQQFNRSAYQDFHIGELMRRIHLRNGGNFNKLYKDLQKLQSAFNEWVDKRDHSEWNIVKYLSINEVKAGKVWL